MAYPIKVAMGSMKASDVYSPTSAGQDFFGSGIRLRMVEARSARPPRGPEAPFWDERARTPGEGRILRALRLWSARWRRCRPREGRPGPPLRHRAWKLRARDGRFARRW